ncbi:MAG: hypothetical protein ACRD2C_14430 [Acidimicrobiales bacterium]
MAQEFWWLGRPTGAVSGKAAKIPIRDIGGEIGAGYCCDEGVHDATNGLDLHCLAQTNHGS